MKTAYLARNEIVAGRWHVICKIQEGGNGQVFFAREASGKGAAIKVEPLEHGGLVHENEVYKDLGNRMGEVDTIGIPEVYYFGSHRRFRVLVMELFGNCLFDVWESIHHYRMKMNHVTDIGMKCVSALKALHDKGMVHRDIKPENIMFGRGERQSDIYLVDFETTVRYRNTVTNEHIPLKTEDHFTGTPQFLSVNGHRNHTLSRRDDLESLGYSLIFLAQGGLDWYDLQHPDSLVMKMRCENKCQMNIRNFLRRLPKPLDAYMSYVFSLSFAEDPNYDMLKAILLQKAVLKRHSSCRQVGRKTGPRCRKMQCP